MVKSYATKASESGYSMDNNMQSAQLPRNPSAQRHKKFTETITKSNSATKRKLNLKDDLSLKTNVTLSLLHLELPTETLQPVTFKGQWKPDN